MGLEAVCRARLNDQAAEGKAHCGDGEIDFRGDFRFRWLWKELAQVTAANGILTVVRGADRAELEIGDGADKWAHAILNPKSRLDKLGLRFGMRYAAWGEFDPEFAGELLAQAGGPHESGLDLVFVRLHDQADLPQLLKARSTIVPSGGVWAVWAKGRKELNDGHVREHARNNGLVDVKVASFSSELSALKLVIPVALRS